MTISYNWLSKYLPKTIEPEKLSAILTSIGLEVEKFSKFETVPGGLQGIITGEVLTCEQHPNADKLKLTTVNIGAGHPLQIVCGAQNVAAGQKVVIAPVGTTIYPVNATPITMKVAKIRGVESQGMICAEDEIGIGTSHAGIIVLPHDAVPGAPVADFFQPYSDIVFEIGLTPNRMDAMSHLGVAKDVCAYLSHHQKKEVKVKLPFNNSFKPDEKSLPIAVTIENESACPRYSGVTISGVKVGPSPQWLKDSLQSIGIRSINNVVDITNFILHETGQPLHAFDVKAIQGKAIIVKTLPENTAFITLDGKERKLHASDLMICNGAGEPMCIAGVFGGAASGVSETTTNIFIESACFNATYIRKTSLTHQLRTDAAIRFEKGIDISNTVQVLKRAALLIKEIAGGSISSDIVDVYPQPAVKKEIAIKYHYLKKLSGKNYHPDTVKRILTALGFEVLKEGIDELWISVPFNKPDISLPADIVEEVLRIDGLDNIDIPTSITISPSIETLGLKEQLREKIAHYLAGLGYHEIVTNSITNSRYFTAEVLQHTVQMMNNLSAELDVMRPGMLETGLEIISYNINRKSNRLRLFEFGKIYATEGVGKYVETEHLSLYLTGKLLEDNWKLQTKPADFFEAKGIARAIMQWCGIAEVQWKATEGTHAKLKICVGKKQIGIVEMVPPSFTERFDIKQTVLFIDIDFGALLALKKNAAIIYKEVPKFPAVQRDLAMIVPVNTTYQLLESIVNKMKLLRLQQMNLFDVFENEKLGKDKKSMAINFTFLDEEKTLTDKEIDSMMQSLMQAFETEANAIIRK
ncbi:phenylalanine--tRNA ligase subunit beta [Hydrotalea sp.]|uniref:phenylalanine--tRNA ligase subunit beta n=1 Tax=Hydrotalea sp. TaxID=2881279 RepID=UPI002582A0C4|nr:phenylalanine--tRNA ligase subunit beta [Hydrotalea sp.]